MPRQLGWERARRAEREQEPGRTRENHIYDGPQQTKLTPSRVIARAWSRRSTGFWWFTSFQLPFSLFKRQASSFRLGGNAPTSRAITTSGDLAKEFPLPFVKAPHRLGRGRGKCSIFIDWSNQSGSCHVCEGVETATLHPRREENVEFCSRSLESWDNARAITQEGVNFVRHKSKRYALPRRRSQHRHLG